MGHPAHVIPFKRTSTASRREAVDFERLERAVIALDAVVHRQKREVGDFRDKIGELRDAVAGIDRSLHRYHEALAGIRIDRVGRRSRRLSSIMDGYLQKKA